MNAANNNGKLFEQQVVDYFENFNFKILDYKELIPFVNNYNGLIDTHGTEIIVKNFKYKTIYGGNGKIEFLCLSKIYNVNTFIECKWQQVSGSVSEKLPYMYLSFKTSESFKNRNIIIVIDGPGWSAGSIDWLKRTSKQKLVINDNNSNISVFNITEFKNWCDTTFKL